MSARPDEGLPNGPRGDVTVRVDGEPRLARLTLGALARIETAFGATTPEALDARLADMSGSDLIVVLSALLSAAGPPIEPEALGRAQVDPGEAAAAVALAFLRASR